MHIYLAPHCDDVCFSISNWAERHGGLLVSLFTRTTYSAIPLPFTDEQCSHLEVVRRTREAEDIAFASEIGLDRDDLMLDDAILSHSDPFAEGDIRSDVALLGKVLLPFLIERFSQSANWRENFLYCPMAIGGHRDHRIALHCIISAIEQLSTFATVALYEDLPYASHPATRCAGIERLDSLINLTNASIHIGILGPNDTKRKMSLINLYKSQHREAPHEADYIPASRLSPSVHEIIRFIPKFN